MVDEPRILNVVEDKKKDKIFSSGKLLIKLKTTTIMRNIES
jgi:hypothetical protein